MLSMRKLYKVVFQGTSVRFQFVAFSFQKASYVLFRKENVALLEKAKYIHFLLLLFKLPILVAIQ